jgi:hypothetical protein
MKIEISKRSPSKNGEELTVVIRTRGTGVWRTKLASEEHSGIRGR